MTPRVLAVAFKWIAKKTSQSVDGYMSQHRKDTDCNELKIYFNTVIDWVSGVFTRAPDKEMRGLEWNRLYETYGSKAYKTAQVEARVNALRADDAVTSAKGIYEYVLGGEADTKLLVVRFFDDKTRRVAYETQTQAAQAAGVSNCPTCATGHDANATRIYKLTEMDADHVAAWSKGGASSADNCQMLCGPHNSAKGNR